jgi:hypothetical protein
MAELETEDRCWSVAVPKCDKQKWTCWWKRYLSFWLHHMLFVIVSAWWSRSPSTLIDTEPMVSTTGYFHLRQVSWANLLPSSMTSIRRASSQEPKSCLFSTHCSQHAPIRIYIGLSSKKYEWAIIARHLWPFSVCISSSIDQLIIDQESDS